MKRIDALLGFTSRRLSRRQIGAVGAGLLALLVGGEPAATKGKKRRRGAKRGQAQQSQNFRRPRQCGGIAGLPCPKGFTCVDDPSDDCDPEAGGADCIGICVRRGQNPCATVRCMRGTHCCPQCGRICIPDDIPCAKNACPGQPCNEATCGPGEYCCNRSCSRCVPIGRGCTKELCPPKGEPCGGLAGLPCPEGFTCVDDPRDDCNPKTGGADCMGICVRKGNDPCAAGACEPCGRTTCPPGQVCCNASCGICTPPNGACIMIACPEEADR